jgi:hypothetical protein
VISVIKNKVLTVLLFFLFTNFVFPSKIVFNNTHLESLSQWFQLDGEFVKGYWVYSENKGGVFTNVGALNEGDFCVDDVARVVLLYSEVYEFKKDKEFLNLALDASKFVIKMQASGDEFYNFAYKDGTINKYGITSMKSSGWWTLRTFCGLSKLAQFVPDETIISALEKTFNAIKRNPPTTAGQMSLYIMGLANYYQIYANEGVKNEIKKYADELVNFQIKNFQGLRGFFSVYKDIMERLGKSLFGSFN